MNIGLFILHQTQTSLFGSTLFIKAVFHVSLPYKVIHSGLLRTI